MARRPIPEHEKQAIAAEIKLLLQQRGPKNERLWTTTSLGTICGGLSPEAIRKAREPAGVGPAVRDAILAVTGQTLEQVMLKHGVVVEVRKLPLLSEIKSYASSGMGSKTARALQQSSTDKIPLARNVLNMLVEDGFTKESVRGAVGELLLEDGWKTEFELYRAVRRLLHERGITETALRDRPQAPAELTPLKPRRKVAGVAVSVDKARASRR